MSPRKEHVVVERNRVGGFQPERWIVCRCGWKSPKHYSAKHVQELFDEHRREVEHNGGKP